MNNFLIGLCTSILVISSSISSFAQETNSLLWKVTGRDITKPSYLFGTIHVLPENQYFFTDKMDSALMSCDVLTLETNMDVSYLEKIKLLQEIMMPDRKGWKDFLTEDEYNQVKATFVDSLGIKPITFEEKYAMIKPFYASGMILADLLGKVKKYEQELTTLAKKANKPIVGLETIYKQMEFAASIPLEDQLIDVILTGPGFLSKYKVFIDAYASQNLEELEKLANEDAGFEKMEAKLLTERNNVWVRLLKKQMAEQSTFTAIGALHLVGENGLISQLRQAGYTVEAVN
ncbi:TraB/GumN family protein [Bacteroidota bacterium]